jgi:23S rRNA (guanosine2251-2'-O)-methyltransferase
VFVNAEQHPDLDQLAQKQKVMRVPFEERAIEKKVGEDAVHQSVAALIESDKLTQDFPQFIETVSGRTSVALALLAEIQDPQNVGSVIRSAAAFGLSGILIPKDRQAQVTGAVIKASAGAAFTVPLVTIGNVNQTIEELKERRFWVYGLAGEGEKNIREEDFSENSVFVIGNEGKGIREKTFEHCDITLRIPIANSVESLNAGVSAAIAFYEWRSKQQ